MKRPPCLNLLPVPANTPARRSAWRRRARLRRQRRERVFGALLAIGSTYAAVWCVQTGQTQSPLFGCLAFSSLVGFGTALTR